jgi:hypothetical protein
MAIETTSTHEVFLINWRPASHPVDPHESVSVVLLRKLLCGPIHKVGNNAVDGHSFAGEHDVDLPTLCHARLQPDLTGFPKS